eukprot:m.48138 g.48138  ORF g.48138 m.48138 type:complete len:371 (-) comp13270_c0_seq3:991-2103(-)
MALCVFCNKALDDEICIECAQCSNVLLCLECFSSGVEHHDHRKTHPYRVIGGAMGPLFAPDWSAADEVNLLNAVEQAGFGNWAKVAQRMRPRTAEECQQHYFRTYVYSKTAPLPDPKVTLGSTEAEATLGDRDKPSTTLIHLEAKYRPKHAPSYAYYRPRRDDYEVEAEDIAELPLSDVVMYPDDPRDLQQLKMSLLYIYQQKLKKRYARRSFATALGLNNPTSILNQTHPPDLKRLLNTLVPFARFQSADKYLSLVTKLQRRGVLRAEIAQYQAYRRLGCRSHDDVKARLPDPTEATRRGMRHDNTSSDLPGLVLSKPELQICRRLRLLPSVYVNLKANHLLASASQKASITQSASKELENFWKGQGLT